MGERIKSALHRNFAAAIRARQLDRAADTLERMRIEDPISLETRGAELEMLIAERRLDEARATAERLVAQFPRSARVALLAGRAAYERRAYAEAERFFAECERLHVHWRATRWLAKARTQLGRYDDAEPALIALAEEHTECRTDLAWLYERKGEYVRALATLEPYLALFPAHEGARDQQRRLKARTTLSPDELLAEVQTLDELGEAVPPELLPRYLETLLAKGLGDKAREFVREGLPRFAPRVALDMAWIAHKRLAFEIATDLFLVLLPSQGGNFKLMNALEKAGDRAGRLPEIAAAYEGLASPAHGEFYGRAKSLRRKLERPVG